MDDLPDHKLHGVGTPQPLDDRMVRVGRGEEAVPAVSSRRRVRHPAQQAEELLRLCRSLTGSAGSARIRRSRFSEQTRLTRRPSQRDRRVIQAVK